MNRKKQNKNGFTLLEVLVSLSLFAFSVILVNSMYVISQRSYNKGANKGELIQNSRVSLDRISRELRQSVNVVTVLPDTNDDSQNPPAEEILFQDGHDVSQTSYLRYYLDGTDLHRSRLVYYFSSEPDIYVTYDSADQNGNPPEESITEDKVVGEYFNKLEFWSNGNLIYISMDLEKNQDSFQIDSGVFTRN